jgi:hypothetical protein
MWSARLATAVPPRALVPASLMHLSLMVLLRRTTVVFPLHATALEGAIWEFIAVLALVRGFDCPISRALRLRGRPPFRIRCLCMGAVVEVTRRQVDYQDERGTRGPSVARGDAASSRGSSGHAVSPSIAVTLLQNIARPFRGRESDLHNLSRAFWLYLTSDARARPRYSPITVIIEIHVGRLAFAAMPAEYQTPLLVHPDRMPTGQRAL